MTKKLDTKPSYVHSEALSAALDEAIETVAEALFESTMSERRGFCKPSDIAKFSKRWRDAPYVPPFAKGDSRPSNFRDHWRAKARALLSALDTLEQREKAGEAEAGATACRQSPVVGIRDPRPGSPADLALTEVSAELERALVKFPEFNSAHEGWAVIHEELDELWAHVRADTGSTLYARHEAIQVAAMALRYAIDLCASLAATEPLEKGETQ